MNLVIPVYERKGKPLKYSRNIAKGDVKTKQSRVIKTTAGRNKFWTSTVAGPQPKRQLQASKQRKSNGISEMIESNENSVPSNGRVPSNVLVWNTSRLANVPVLENIAKNKSPIPSPMSDISSLPSPPEMPPGKNDVFIRESKKNSTELGNESIVGDAFEIAKEDLKKMRENTRKSPNHRPRVRIEEKHKVQEDSLVMKSFNCCVLPDNRQVTFKVGMENPYDSMTIFSYDTFPIIVKEDDCLIRVESSSVSFQDCVIRQGNWVETKIDPAPSVPGFDIIGTVTMCGKEVRNAIKVGDRVASIVISGGNSRYIIQKASKLIKLPKAGNSETLCSLLSAYVPAFLCLNEGCEEAMRHDDDSLRGQTIFVSGGMSVIGQAAIHLAIILGAKKVYASAMKKDHRHLKRLGAIPVYLSEDLTFAGLQDKIDLFVDFTAYNEFQGLTVVKEGSGRVVYYHLGDIGEEGKHGTRSQLENFFLKISVMMSQKQSYICNHLNYFNDDFDSFKVDFRFLQTMLSTNNDKFKPQPIVTLPLSEIPNAHYMLEYHNVRGVLVCDPWT